MRIVAAAGVAGLLALVLMMVVFRTAAPAETEAVEAPEDNPLTNVVWYAAQHYYDGIGHLGAWKCGYDTTDTEAVCPERYQYQTTAAVQNVTAYDFTADEFTDETEGGGTSQGASLAAPGCVSAGNNAAHPLIRYAIAVPDGVDISGLDVGGLNQLHGFAKQEDLLTIGVRDYVVWVSYTLLDCQAFGWRTWTLR